MASGGMWLSACASMCLCVLAAMLCVNRYHSWMRDGYSGRQGCGGGKKKEAKVGVLSAANGLYEAAGTRKRLEREKETRLDAI